ncbi:ExbD/TolR family protein [Pontibacter burrus]|uniref:Biopolymer transporter ExbD n=1 Tax=Pontibacter burrus TaxID=2704466 RepID=A0A6B3LYD2_9BACT|nr:biopolymer transporter ExbD [Pontibacter burrus]NEM98434.1 biopolymer transporter ExbD [Pontibacter burrus]
MNFRRTKNRGHAAVEAASLSDILFFLLLFFLIVATMASPNAIKVLLPKASSEESVPRNIINLTITEQLEYYIEQQPVPAASLKEALASISATTISPTVVLRVDKTIQVNELIKVVDVINSLKLPMVVATEKASN